MVTASIKAVFDRDIDVVWRVVTSVEEYWWRTDLERIEVMNEDQFIEYSKGGYATLFTTTVMIPNERWEFDMDSDNLAGRWVGTFAGKDGQTEIVFTEVVEPKRAILRPFVKLYLRRQQKAYVRDLAARLRREKRG